MVCATPEQPVPNAVACMNSLDSTLVCWLRWHLGPTTSQDTSLPNRCPAEFPSEQMALLSRLVYRGVCPPVAGSSSADLPYKKRREREGRSPQGFLAQKTTPLALCQMARVEK